MFDFNDGQKQKETCFVSYGTMGHLDPTQPPSKRKPYSAILNMPYISRIDLILPKSDAKRIESKLKSIPQPPTYQLVTMPLSSIFEGDFFTEYIKKGNIFMLSEGVHGVDNVYSLRDGILTMTLDKETYERAGLVGKPDGAKGARAARARWIVEINLRQPSMLHGKKGFDRIVYAAKNVLNKPAKWLFCNLQSVDEDGKKIPSPDPLDQFNPVSRLSELESWTSSPVHVPALKPPTEASAIDGIDDFGEFSNDLYEWLSLIQLESPRVSTNDSIDPFLSRYTTPQAPENSSPEPLEKLSWHGFISPKWAHEALVQTVLSVSPKSWFAFAVSGFGESLPAGSRDCTILRIPGRSSEYMLWEVERN